MSEIAIVSARKSRLDAAAKRGDKSARAALDTANNPNRFLSTVQIGITLIGILTGMFSGETITHQLTEQLSKISSLHSYAESIAITIVVSVLTFLTLVIGELVPKRIGLANPEMLAKLTARPMKFISTLTSPFVWLLTITTDSIIHLSGIRPSTDSKVTEEEIKAIIQEGTDGGAIQEIEQDIVERVFNLGDRKVSSLMTHRSNVVVLKLNFSSAQVRNVVNAELHSVYPVLDDKEKIVGIVVLKDLFKNINQPDFQLSDYLQSAKYIVENISAYEALRQFKSSHTHHALVVDEYGDMQGIITLNDLFEALVGDVSEFHASEFSFIEREDGSWLIDGQYPLSEFLHRFDLSVLSKDYPFDTLSGLILHQLKKVPETGEKCFWLNFEIEVIDMDGVRIDKVLVRYTS